ncbi:uroporphyrinogen-III synthase [Candidatus Omnitrophus magneticus]|uniref:uroporphyrinogen-III C-methyltransferase n=1 Tax=Candidatus Omnitrophus magneticus TaxID=1609969 RepID=A0A0F0CS23_9BACT|nr:uroporphyrinogen-III synthase [Candidatus Omnitrophus magneticus]
MESKKNKFGMVYIVGAGPGDLELITVKGFNILKKADVVLYDFLSSLGFLKFVPQRCEKICVGKSDGFHILEQKKINQLLFEKAKEHEVVVRLKSGDPFVFSRGIEEARFLKNKGVNYEIIPGVTTAFAGPVSFGIPLTVKDKIQSVAVITGRKKYKNADIYAPKPHNGTIVYLMAVSNIANIVKALINAGWEKSTPCAFIENATKKNERLIKGTIAVIEKSALKNKVVSPSVLVVGEVLKYRV